MVIKWVQKLVLHLSAVLYKAYLATYFSQLLPMTFYYWDMALNIIPRTPEFQGQSRYS